MANIKLKDGSVRSVEDGSTVLELVKQVSNSLAKKVLAAKMDGKTVKDEVIRSTSVYFTLFVFVYLFSVLLLSFDDMDFTTNFTAVLATLNNMGPGLNLVGPTRNFFDYSVLSKYVLMFDMLAGRLELYPMLLLFAPTTWRNK